MKIEYQITLAALGVLLLIAQITLIGFKVQEKRETKRMFSDPDSMKVGNPDHFRLPGFAQICIEHAKKLVKIETCLKNLFQQREREFKETYRWKEEVRDNFKRVFDKIEK